MDLLIQLKMFLFIDKLSIRLKSKFRSLFLKFQAKIQDQRLKNSLNITTENLFLNFLLKIMTKYKQIHKKLRIITLPHPKEEMNMLNPLNILCFYRYIIKNLDLKKISNKVKSKLMLTVFFSLLLKIMISELLILQLILWDLLEKLTWILLEEDVVKKLVFSLKLLNLKISQDLMELLNQLFTVSKLTILMKYGLSVMLKEILLPFSEILLKKLLFRNTQLTMELLNQFLLLMLQN